LKIALLISGQTRTFRTTSKYLNKYQINGVVPDIFLNIWDDEISNGFREELKSVYQPKFILTSTAPEDCTIDLNNKIYNTNPQNTRQMFFARYRLVKKFNEYCCEKNVNYDVIILTRYDIVLTRNIFIDKSKFHGLENDTILLFNGAYSSEFGGVNDMIAAGSRKAINKYVEIYNNFEKEVEQFSKCDFVVNEFIPEVILGRFLKKTFQNLIFFNNSILLTRSNYKKSLVVSNNFYIINYLSSELLYGSEILDLINDDRKKSFSDERVNKLLTKFSNIFITKSDLLFYFSIISHNHNKGILFDYNERSSATFRKIFNKIIDEISSNNNYNEKLAYAELSIFFVRKYHSEFKNWVVTTQSIFKCLISFKRTYYILYVLSILIIQKTLYVRIISTK
jgi:hypothetical protein